MRFDQKIAKPPLKLGDPYRFLTDKLERPDRGRLSCSYLGCAAKQHFTSREWYGKSYMEFRTGNAAAVHVARVWPDYGWQALRVWDRYYAFCPKHGHFWKGGSLAETILLILQHDRGQLITSPERDELIRMACVWDYRRFKEGDHDLST